METYISILRGINVNGQKLIKMDALKKAYEDLRFKNIHTYIQSGNVIFQSDQSERKKLEQKISDQIQKLFGFEVPVIILTIEELRRIIKNNLYKDDDAKDIKYLHVTVLSSKPVNTDTEIVRLKQLPGEEFKITENVVYLYCPNGYGRTKLTNTFWENLLKVNTTTRNWKTINELLRIAENIQ